MGLQCICYFYQCFIMNQEEFISTSKVFLVLCQARGGPYGLDLSTEYSLLSKLSFHGLLKLLSASFGEKGFWAFLELLGGFFIKVDGRCDEALLIFFLKSYSELKSQKLYIEDFKSYQHKNVTEHFSHIQLIRQSYSNHGAKLRVFLFILIIKK